MISLLNANGDPVSTFGTGNSQFAGGAETNPGRITPMRTFVEAGSGSGSGMSGAAAAITPTAAGSTKLGFQDPTKAPRGARGHGPMLSHATGASVPKLVPDEEIGLKPANWEGEYQKVEALQRQRQQQPTQEELDEYLAATRGSEAAPGTTAPPTFWGGIMRDTGSAAGDAAEEGL